MMHVAVEGVGLLAPGLQGWVDSRSVLAGGQPYRTGPVPDPEAALLPPNERRRSSDCVRWTVQVAQEGITQSGLDSEGYCDGLCVIRRRNGGARPSLPEPGDRRAGDLSDVVSSISA